MTESSVAEPEETTMRINARLDDSRSRKLAYLARATSQATTEVVKRAIDLYYEQETATRRSAAEVLHSVGFVGSGKASPDLSTNYKSELQAILAEKYDHR